MATINAPFNHADQQAVIGYSARDLEILKLELGETLNPLDGMLLSMWGSLTGAASDTIRIDRVGNWGPGVPFASMTETGTVAPSAITENSDSLTIAQYGLGRSATYKSRILGGSWWPTWQNLKDWLPASVFQTLRDLLSARCALFSTTIGGTGTAWTVDDHLALAAVFTAAVSSYGLGRPQLWAAPKLLTDLQTSARSETALQYGGPSFFGQAQGVNTVQRLNDYLSLGIDLVISGDVDDDGVDYQCGAFRPGTVGIGFADPSVVVQDDPDPESMVLPEFGLLVQRILDGRKQRTLEMQATMWAGTAEGSVNVFGPRRRCLVVK